MVKTYSSLDDFDNKTQAALERILHDDETFITAILGKVTVFTRALFLGTGLYERVYQKLILTDRRVIAYKRGWIRQRSNDFPLDAITTVEYTKGVITGKIAFQGAGFEKRYKTSKDTGLSFSIAVSEQLQHDTPIVEQPPPPPETVSEAS